MECVASCGRHDRAASLSKPAAGVSTALVKDAALSRRLKRAVKKKERRKAKRRAAALAEQENIDALQKDPEYIRRRQEDERVQRLREEWEKQERDAAERLWLAREKIEHEKSLRLIEKERLKKEEEEERLRRVAEWEQKRKAALAIRERELAASSAPRSLLPSIPKPAGPSPALRLGGGGAQDKDLPATNSSMVASSSEGGSTEPGSEATGTVARVEGAAGVSTQEEDWEDDPDAPSEILWVGDEIIVRKQKRRKGAVGGKAGQGGKSKEGGKLAGSGAERPAAAMGPSGGGSADQTCVPRAVCMVTASVMSTLCNPPAPPGLYEQMQAREAAAAAAAAASKPLVRTPGSTRASARVQPGGTGHAEKAAAPGGQQGGEACQFYAKTGACRFGARCQRRHPPPSPHTILVLPGMYSSRLLEQRAAEAAGAGSGPLLVDGTLLRELQQEYEEFFEDVHDEMCKFGRVVNFKVCSNTAAHLHGNLYVEFASLSSAVDAKEALDGRYYGGEQLACEFAPTSMTWQNAVCGVFIRGQTCRANDSCNFLHPWRNTDGLYHLAGLSLDRHPHQRWPENANTNTNTNNASNSNNSNKPAGSSREGGGQGAAGLDRPGPRWPDSGGAGDMLHDGTERDGTLHASGDTIRGSGPASTSRRGCSGSHRRRVDTRESRDSRQDRQRRTDKRDASPSRRRAASMSQRHGERPGGSPRGARSSNGDLAGSRRESGPHGWDGDTDGGRDGGSDRDRGNHAGDRDGRPGGRDLPDGRSRGGYGGQRFAPGEGEGRGAGHGAGGVGSERQHHREPDGGPRRDGSGSSRLECVAPAVADTGGGGAAGGNGGGASLLIPVMQQPVGKALRMRAQLI
eukprot:jgi/Mesvir1/9649/Mv12140-RA.1